MNIQKKVSTFNTIPLFSKNSNKFDLKLDFGVKDGRIPLFNGFITTDT